MLRKHFHYLGNLPKHELDIREEIKKTGTTYGLTDSRMVSI